MRLLSIFLHGVHLQEPQEVQLHLHEPHELQLGQEQLGHRICIPLPTFPFKEL